jgi:mannose-6-phosphate isomerase-like protein (cupin superfamily)
VGALLPILFPVARTATHLNAPPQHRAVGVAIIRAGDWGREEAHDGERCELGPGDACYFPADTMHVCTVTSEKPAKLLVVYSPPYNESPDKVVRP